MAKVEREDLVRKLISFPGLDGRQAEGVMAPYEAGRSLL